MLQGLNQRLKHGPQNGLRDSARRSQDRDTHALVVRTKESIGKIQVHGDKYPVLSNRCAKNRGIRSPVQTLMSDSVRIMTQANEELIRAPSEVLVELESHFEEVIGIETKRSRAISAP